MTDFVETMLGIVLMLFLWAAAMVASAIPLVVAFLILRWMFT